jgi:hypothetical protein
MSRLLDNMSLLKKIALIAAVLVIPIAVLLVLLFLQMEGDYSFAVQERAGAAYMSDLGPLIRDLSDYRIGLGSSAQLADAVAKVDAANATYGKTLKVDDTWQTLKGHIAKFAAAPSANADALVAEAETLLGNVSDNSNITLDPVLETYYVGDTAVNKLPTLIDSATAGAAVALGLNGRRPTTDQAVSMSAAIRQLDSMISATKHNVDVAAKAVPAVRANIGASVDKALAASGDVENALKRIVSAAKPAGRGAIDARSVGAATLSLAGAYGASDAELTRLLDLRIGGIMTRALAIALFTLVMILVALVLIGLDRALRVAAPPAGHASDDRGHAVRGRGARRLDGAPRLRRSDRQGADRQRTARGARQRRAGADGQGLQRTPRRHQERRRRVHDDHGAALDARDADQGVGRTGQHRCARDRGGQYEPLAADRGAGLGPRRERLFDGRIHRDRQTELGLCPRSQ